MRILYLAIDGILCPAFDSQVMVMVAGIAVLCLVESYLLMNHRVPWICWAFVAIGLAYRHHLEGRTPDKLNGDR